VSAHPLGGAVIGKVCDLDGRVENHPGLYVVDGALIEGSTGLANPSFTIAALAERCMDRIVPRLHARSARAEAAGR
jgi:cholesterol oxidase